MRTFSIKFSDEQAAYIEVLAAEQGQTLSAFIRERVFAKDELHELLGHMQTGLHAAIWEASNQLHRTDKTTSDPDANNALMLEAVMLLRSLTNPQTVSAVHAELRRRGIAPNHG